MAFSCFVFRNISLLTLKLRRCFSELDYFGRNICTSHIFKSNLSVQFRRNINTFQTLSRSKAPRIFIYGGILTSVGITTEDDDGFKIIRTIKRGILAAFGFKTDEEEDKLIHTIKLGIVSMKKEDFNTAERILHAALKIAQEREDPKAVTYIYDVLANVAFQKGDLKKAETLFVETMKRLIAAGMSTDDNAVVNISLKLASIFDKQKLFEKAEEGYRFCIDAQKKKIDQIDLSQEAALTELEQDTLLLWAMSRDWYGKHLLAIGKLKEAQENLVMAHGMSERINGPLHYQTLVLLNDIASIATQREQFDEAIHFLEWAIENGKLANTPDLAAFYCNLGATLMKKGDYSEALKCCKDALNLAAKTDQEEAATNARECIEELKKLGVK